LDRHGLEIQPWTSTKCGGGQLSKGGACVLATLDQKPHIEVNYKIGQKNVFECRQGVPIGTPVKADPAVQSNTDNQMPICAGAQRDPFPSAVVHVVATFVDPMAQHYDPAKGSYVVGPVMSKVYYQFAGIRHLPDQFAKGDARLRTKRK
jgi:hypothetical protein